ncbi:MAG TPA: hypothetical protein VEF76_07520 [Patescibacteria group bacterium]|nr:hypothetical protein [Patescibacteria group bacterium]
MRDNIVIVVLIFFIVATIIVSLPAEKISAYQPLISSLVAIIAATIAYAGNLNGIAEKHLKEERAKELEKMSRSRKLIFLMMAQARILTQELSQYNSIMTEVGNLTETKLKAWVSLVKTKYLVLPSIMADKYSEYLQLEDNVVESLAHVQTRCKNSELFFDLILRSENLAKADVAQNFTAALNSISLLLQALEQLTLHAESALKNREP